MPVKAVIFDIGGVLVQGSGDRSRKDRWEKRLGLESGALDRTIWSLPASVRANVGLATEDEVWQEVTQHFALTAHESAQLRADYFSDSVWNEALIGFARALRPRYKTGVVSNAWPTARTAIVDHVNAAMFDDMVFSAEVGLAKPDRRIFELAVYRLRVKPAEAIFIDDVQKNVEVAQAIGLAGILYQNTRQVIAEIEEYLHI